MFEYRGAKLNLISQAKITDKQGVEYILLASPQNNPLNPKQSFDTFFLFTKATKNYAGCITFKSVTPNQTHIPTLSINPNLQQRGLGTALLKYTIKYLQDCNNDIISLLASFGEIKDVRVLSDNGEYVNIKISNNILFYKRFGFDLNYAGILKRAAIANTLGNDQLDEADMHLLKLQKVDVASLPKNITLLTEQQTLELSPDTLYDQALYKFISGKLHM